MDDNKAALNSEFSDALKVEGVNFKGFGVIPKYVMLDPDLTLESKTIYAYFCSFAGAGNTAFPSRDTIIKNLSINKDTYYKHFAALITQGYISVARDLSAGKNGRNIYTLVTNPKKFVEPQNDVNGSKAYNKIRFNGLKSFGYGIIPKAIMIDNRLPFKAKGIYAYFCSLTGSGNNAFPKLQQILFQLRIAKNTYYKFYNELLNLNYITVVQRTINGEFDVNDYFINDTPDLDKALNKSLTKINNHLGNFSESDSHTPDSHVPIRKISDINENPVNQGFSPIRKFSDIEENLVNPGSLPIRNSSDIKIPDIKFSDIKIPDNNNNNTISNILKINQSINQQPAAVPPTKEMDGSTSELEQLVWDELWRERALPHHYSLEEPKMTSAIHIMTDWIYLKNGFDNDFRQAVYNLFNNALIEMCCTQTPIKLKDNLVNSGMVIQKLNGFIDFDDGGSDYPATIAITKLQDEVMSDFEIAASKSKIHNHMQFMKACIWSVMQNGGIGFLADAKRHGYI